MSFESVFSPAIINHSQSSFLGPVLYGCLLESAMFGVVAVQFHSYLSKNEDRWTLRSFVFALSALAFAGTILAFFSAYENFVIHYGNKTEFLNDVGTLTAHHAITVLVVGMVELYFAYRVIQVSKKAWFVSILISFFALSGFVCGLTSTVLGVHWNTRTERERTTYWITSGLSYTFPVLSSTISTISLCVVLRSVRTEALWTHSVVNSLILYTINRGLLMTATQTVMMILVFVAPQRLFWAPFYAILNKVCLSTLLVMLNSRTSLRSKSGINAFSSSGEGKDSETCHDQDQDQDGSMSTRAINRMSRMSRMSRSSKVSKMGRSKSSKSFSYTYVYKPSSEGPTSTPLTGDGILGVGRQMSARRAGMVTTAVGVGVGVGEAFSTDDTIITTNITPINNTNTNLRQHTVTDLQLDLDLELAEDEDEEVRRNHWSLLEPSPQFLQSLGPALSVTPSLAESDQENAPQQQQGHGNGMQVQAKRETMSSMDDVGFEWH